MDFSHSKSDTLAARLRRRRREILFATVLTLAAGGYLLASHKQVQPKAPVAMTGKLKQVQ